MSKAVSDWLKSLRQKSPSRSKEKTEEDAVVQSLISEVEMQIRASEEFHRQQQLALRRRGSQVDYTWLLSTSAQKTYEIPPMEKMHLAELASKVKPYECNIVISQFREQIADDCDASEIPRFMCHVILDLLSKRDDVTNLVAGHHRVPNAFIRALNLVKLPGRIAPDSPRRQSARRNSTMPTGNVASDVFLVERAFSFPLLKMDKLDEHRSQMVPDIPPL